MSYRVAALCALLLPAAVMAGEVPAVVPIPLPAKPTVTERMILEAQRRDIDRRLMLERLEMPTDAAGLRRLNTLRGNRQRIDRALAPPQRPRPLTRP